MIALGTGCGGREHRWFFSESLAVKLEISWKEIA